MYHLLHPLLLFSALTLTLPTFSLPSPLTSPQSNPAPLHPVSTIHEFPKGTWVENLAVRANGLILTTFVSAAQVVQISPDSLFPPQTVATFPGYTSTLGIVEAETDVFYVVAGNFSLQTFAPTVGSWSIFQLDLRSCQSNPHDPPANSNGGNKPKITKIADFPTAGLLNGLTILPSPNHHPNPPYSILIADSSLGAIYTLNPLPPHQTSTLQQPLLAPNASATPRIGVNGLHVNNINNRLYFTSSNQALLGSLPLSVLRGEGREGARVEAQGIGGDDFAFADDQGIAYVAVGGLDELVRVPVGSRAGAGQAVVVANVTAGPTSVRFARGGRGRSVYVSSNGGARGYLPGGRVEVGGRVSRVVLG